MWRRRIVGELFMGLSTKWGFRMIASRQSQTDVPDAVADAAIDNIWQYFDHGTQRAILRLYRSAPEPLLAEAGRDLGKITAPTLVVWGAQDPYLEERFAHAYAEAVGGPAEVAIFEGAGHWPWYEKPEVIDRIASFLAALAAASMRRAWRPSQRRSSSRSSGCWSAHPRSTWLRTPSVRGCSANRASRTGMA